MADNNTILEKLEGLVARFEEVSTLITDPAVIADQKRYVKLTKEYKELGDLMNARKEYMQVLGGIEEAKEIIANESQERMGLLIDESAIEHVQKIADRERAPMYTVGETTGDARFAFEQADGVRPFDLAVDQMFGSSPKTYMVDKTVERHYENVSYETSKLNEYIRRVLQLEAVACKDWLTNKVDRSVTGKIARQQCQGEIQLPLSDCGVVALDYRGEKGIATSLGHAPQAALANPAAGSVLSVAEALTNIVWAPMAEGLDSISLSANWMWPCRAQEGEDARLYTAVKALSDFCCSLQINVPTGKDSLSMTQKYPNGEKIISPGTVIVSAGGEVSDVKKVVSPVLVNDEKSTIYHIDFSFDKLRLGGSAFAQSLNKVGDDVPTVQNPEYFRDAFLAVQELVNKGLIMAGHDISAGGLITTLLEMCFSNMEGGMEISLNKIKEDDIIKILFAENPGIVIQVKDKHKEEVKKIAKLFIDELKVRLLNEHQITLKITSSAMDLLADKGYDENYGARPLRRVIQNEIEDVLADKILEGTLSNGQTMTIGKKDKKLTFSVKETSK